MNDRTPTVQECIDGLVAHVIKGIKDSERAVDYDTICEWTIDTHELEIRYAIAEALNVSTD